MREWWLIKRHPAGKTGCLYFKFLFSLFIPSHSENSTG
jgi:hypothetical protein